MTLPIAILGFVLICLCTGFVFLFLIASYRKKAIEALIFKGAASLCFVIFGAVNCFDGEIVPSALFIFIGLCLGIMGDEIIALGQVFPQKDDEAFLGGGAFFLVGHICYIVALLFVGEINLVAVLIAAAFMAGFGGLYAHRRKFLAGKKKSSLSVYLGIVIAMAAIAIGAFAQRGILGAAFFALGGLLLVASDNILFAYKYGEKPFFLQNVILHATYYLAQFSICWSVGFF